MRGFMIRPPHQILLGWENRRGMWHAWGKRKISTGIWLDEMNERPTGGSGFKWGHHTQRYFGEVGREVQTGLIWLRIRRSDESLWRRHWNFGSYKIRWISLLIIKWRTTMLHAVRRIYICFPPELGMLAFNALKDFPLSCSHWHTTQTVIIPSVYG